MSKKTRNLELAKMKKETDKKIEIIDKAKTEDLVLQDLEEQFK